jgi:hypothetical protein
LALAALRERYPDLFDAGELDLSPFELSVFSQNGEDGVVLEILHRIGTETRWFVEFGAGDGTENCCALLADVLGWSGLFGELDDESFGRLSTKYRNNPRVTTLQGAITPENVGDTFRRAGVPETLDVLSIDVDGSDYWIWHALDGYRPRVVIIEYNSSIDATEILVQPREVRAWSETSYFGASVGALVELGRDKGYTLVHQELAGTNAFFVRDDLLWKDVRAPISRGPSYDLMGHQHAPPPADARYVDPRQA